MKKLLFFLFFFIILNSLFLIQPANAAIRYPLNDLGNCRDAKECKLYCDIPVNTPACWSYFKYGPPANVLGVTSVIDAAAAAKIGIKFPVADLGNCASPQECRDYCKLEANKSVCSDFAIKMGIQKTRVKEINRTVLQKAKSELGCDSATSCHNFCRKTENQDSCQSFGQKYELVKKMATSSSQLKPEILTKAQNELGCSNELSCRNLCNNPENLKKCQAFAARYSLGKLSGSQKAGLAKEMIKSGLCSNEVECAAYCQKNPSSCPGFKTASGSATNSKNPVFLGPGGCRTERECYEYCKAHPEACPNFPKASTQSFSDLPRISVNPSEKPPLLTKPPIEPTKQLIQ